MAVTVVGTPTSASSASATSVSVTKPTGIVAGDTLFAFCTTASGGSFTTPTSALGSWTAQTTLTNTGNPLFVNACYTLPVTNASLLTDTSFTISTGVSSGQLDAVINIFRGANFTTFIDSVSSGGWISGISGTTVCTATTAVATNALLVELSYFADAASGTVTTTQPSGMTQVYSVTSPNTSAYFENQMAYQQLTAAGSTGTKTVTYSAQPSNGARAILFTVNPAPVSVKPTIINRVPIIRATSF